MTIEENLTGSLVLVTGGAGGIGRGVVEAVLERGGRAAVLDLTVNERANISLLCDLTEADAVDSAVARIAEQVGSPNRIVCAAGIVREGPFEDLDPRQWHRTIDVSLTSAYLVLRATVPGMVRQGGGAIVTMSSGWGRKGYPFGADYSAAKSGIEGLTKSIALEFADRGVRANSIAPGPIKTAMIRDNPAFDEGAKVSAIPMKRLGEVSDVVEPTMFLLSDRAAYITGQVLHVNGGLLMP